MSDELVVCHSKLIYSYYTMKSKDSEDVAEPPFQEVKIRAPNAANPPTPRHCSGK